MTLSSVSSLVNYFNFSLLQVTIERDLQIRRKFKDVSLLWTLLELTAWYRPALAYCSVLLRGITATVMANWNTEEGVSLVNIMALGQLLPPPLASIRDILPVLQPHQVCFYFYNIISIKFIYSNFLYFANGSDCRSVQ